ncbi:ATP-dependent Clp protease adapter ClpS [Rudaeicoccus suwonensis]|uniref:ATP-dependent Clp protease adapter protein ClpS n=1 Tax=Rudaeicoccus suwonensis TaxID=657409 RepID=A0A561E9B3_9MICO|nr:ATP-dependent Clp protease adaptor protein ClpS [Rudaeicoccus suwonensis]
MSVAPPQHATPDVDVESDAASQLDQPWVTIVWNDPVNLMSYVAWVFQNYFGYSIQESEKLMLKVHRDGKAVVANGPREKMETDTEAMHGYGLWATFEKDN